MRVLYKTAEYSNQPPVHNESRKIADPTVDAAQALRQRPQFIHIRLDIEFNIDRISLHALSSLDVPSF